jgi:multidrug efflux pump subunit AcrA (membrane-fusion protein)
LLERNAVSPQDADTRAAAAQATKATADAAQANVVRLEQLESFKRVVAPFDGVVTLRNTDVGALINAGQSAGSQLFRVADTSRASMSRYPSVSRLRRDRASRRCCASMSTRASGIRRK